MTMRGVQKPPRPKNKKKTVAISKILMAPAPSGPPRKMKQMSPGELKARTGKTVTSKRKTDIRKMANGGDLAKMIKTSGRIGDMDKARANKAIMNFVKKIKPTGRPSDLDVQRAINAFKMARKGQKPVLDSKGKPVKNLTQKAGPGKPMSDEKKRQLRRFKDVLKGMPKNPKRKIRPKDMTPLMGTAGRGMRKGFGSRSMKAAAKKLKRIM